MTLYAMPARDKNSFVVWDILFFLCLFCFCWLSLRGIELISANGAILDSDLQTYAQGMTGERYPDLFNSDPALDSVSEANSIPNLQRWLAFRLTPGDAFHLGLLRAGAVAVFVFYAGWYILGRWLLRFPSLAASLALVCGVTFWVGWGTFWGVTHSDPVPRTFFGAVFPFLLLFFLSAVNRPWLRPFCMAAVGCGAWIHGISAINCGAMFFLAFAFLKPVGQSLPNHINNCFVSLILFLAPVAAFVWPSLQFGREFTKEQLELFSNFLSIRWSRDYSNFWHRLAAFFSPAAPQFALFVCAVAGFFAIIFKGNPREKLYARAAPFFVIAFLCVAVFSWAESEFAPRLGRVPMGHELVRGLRFIIPLAWLLTVCGLACLLGKIGRRVLCALCLGLVLCFTNDRQYMAAQYELGRLAGVDLPLSAEAARERGKAEKYAGIMRDIEKIVPPNETIFSNSEDMAARYLARRPLAHTFKDGYLHFYNKDYEKSRRWLEYERIMKEGPNGVVNAWLKSEAPWFLGANIRDKDYFRQFGKIELDKDGYILVKKR